MVTLKMGKVQGGCFSPLVLNGDEEDIIHIAADPYIVTTLRRTRVLRDNVARSLAQRIRSIIRSVRGRGHISEERLIYQISQMHNFNDSWTYRVIGGHDPEDSSNSTHNSDIQCSGIRSASAVVSRSMLGFLGFETLKLVK
ncbi:hypothetical protein M5K25_009521 [Dendrobium thyrsiflorum]|uniref:Uncharacterized protein n=1 Tax=Dendrobium thyrsiflorum TaxID=117978 RepID=A0ABD0V619_DENTH